MLSNPQNSSNPLPSYNLSAPQEPVVDGIDLASLIASKVRIPERVLCEIAAEVASELARRHQLDPPEVHGTLRPLHVVVAHSGRVILRDRSSRDRPSGELAPELIREIGRAHV